MYKKLILCGWLLALFITIPSRADTNNPAKLYHVATESDDVVSRVLFDAIAHEFGIDIQYVTYTSYDDLLNSVERGDSDFAANVTYTEGRSKYFDFSSPINVEYSYLFTRSTRTLNSLHSVAVPRGSIYGKLLEDKFPRLEVQYFNGINEAQDMLKTAQVDGVVSAINQLRPMLAKGYEAQLLNDKIMVHPVSMIATKGKHLQMLKQFEHFAYSNDMQKLLRDTIARYQFDMRRQALRQRVLDSGINAQRTLKVKFQNLPIYANYQNDGQVKGISADVVMKACDILLLRCEIASRENETWEHMFQDLREGDIDVVAPIIISDERKKFVNFSDSYYHPHALLIKRENYKNGLYHDISEMVVERIGVIKDDFFEELLHNILPHKSLSTFNSQKELVKAVLDGDVDYIVLSQADYIQVLRDSPKMLPLVVDERVGDFYQFDVAIGFKKDVNGLKLAHLFSQALNIIDTDQVIKRYEYQPDWRSNMALQKRYDRNSQIMLVLVILLLLFIGFYVQRHMIIDSLTKARNRRSLCRRFVHGVPKDLSLVYVEVDDFKEINEKYGFDIGDAVLKELARRMKSLWKGQCYRFSGDEFVAVNLVSPKDVQAYIEHIESYIYVDSERELSFPVKLSIGVSLSREHAMPLSEVLHLIYQQMKESKIS
ncbi:GGDEF domain-containing protein [Vibrio porteresiae]|uniref:GGDEF domain-containing protein n=1 Tax=Vibrio porteresiae DSM 19223 TaxID=1123496 RepID=A0ABZ0QFS2_9VIBR|nr:GGDEF domain-containing protein [Vibrio porteresiae]WPC75032.1 GGDEF domain-containing protein [Vibrio porteresiae DSM 19223]